MKKNYLKKGGLTMKRILDSLLNKIIYASMLTMVIAIGSGCSVALKHQPLNSPSQQYSDQIGTSSKAEGLSGLAQVGSGRFTVFAIPVTPVYIEGDGSKKIMELVHDALKQVGYDITVYHSETPSEVPLLKCKVENFWFNNYTWFAPFVPTWGNIQLKINLLSPDEKVLWSKNFRGKGFSANFFNGFTSATNKSMRKILNEMVKEFSGEEFHQALTNYSSKS